MAMHAHHESLPGFHPAQIFHDHCPECERRGADVPVALAHMDDPTFARAWSRAGELARTGLRDTARAEAPLLHVLEGVQLALENWGVPLGQLPTGATLPLVPRNTLEDE
jgi:hypothetical protein